MALAGITRQGLAAIAFLVAVLWGCVLMERSTIRDAKIQTYRALREVQYLKMHRTTRPASTPAPLRAPAIARPNIG
ncbi:MAG: hypothetical protein IT158_06235 [Bryobacterales bacterium]|jgi:hypothetical protein|nr:hypothetical protein [Bryobacterales bacterium]